MSVIDRFYRFLTWWSCVFVQASGIMQWRWYRTTLLNQWTGFTDINFNISVHEHKRLISIYIRWFLSVTCSRRHTIVPGSRRWNMTNGHRLLFLVALLFSFPKEAYDSLHIWWRSFNMQKNNCSSSDKFNKMEALNNIAESSQFP